jgi:hypothetical protein
MCSEGEEAAVFAQLALHCRFLLNLYDAGKKPGGNR